MSVGDIRVRDADPANKGKLCRTNLVVVTGGEPLLQNVLPLCEVLTRQGFHVQFETAGTVWVDGLEKYIPLLKGVGEVSLVCSPKSPKVHRKVELFCNHWKYLIREGEV